MKVDLEYLEAVKAELLEKFPGAVFAHVGSTYISGEGNDLDLVMHVESWTLGQLMDLGYTYTGQESGEEDEFNTYRRDVVNLMVSSDPLFLFGFSRAAEVCKFLHEAYNFGDKTIRIGVHRAIMNGEDSKTIRARLGLVTL